MKKTKVLLVEDDETTAFAIVEQLKKLGMEVTGTAVNDRQAMICIEQETPDLIIMDIMLRGDKNGVETAMEIYKKAEIPVIFISAPGHEQMIKEAKFIQNSLFLQKPFTFQKLGETIQKIQDEFLSRTTKHIEAERIKALHRYEILDTPDEGNFDRITRIAAKVFNMPVALISLVDQDRIWFKSRYGYPEKEISRTELSSSKFITNDFFQIVGPDQDPIVLVDPGKARDIGFKFHAATPLITNEGHNLGTLCILDTKKREITISDKEILIELAAIVMDEMELRLSSRNAYRLQKEFINTAMHDLKNPLSGILSLSELLKNREENKETVIKFNRHIKKAANKMLKIIDELLETAWLELKNIKLNLTNIDLADLANEVVSENLPQAERKNQSLKINIKSHPIVNVDPERIREVFDNLISNAIKYSPREKPIEVIINQVNGNASFEVKDLGHGLTEKDKEKLFGKFARLSAQPTGEETSTGLGLSIVKNLVELHGGKVKAESEGEGKGSTFEVELPVV